MRVALFNDTTSDSNHYGCSIVVNNLTHLVSSSGAEITYRFPVGLDWRENRHLLPKPGDIDLVLVNGEGSMHGAPHRERAVTLSQLGRFTKEHYGVKSYLINATLYNNDETFYGELRNFDGIFVRDGMSRDEARAHGLAVELCPDLTLVRNVPLQQMRRSGIGVTDSVRIRLETALKDFAISFDAEFVRMADRKSHQLGFSLSSVRKVFRDSRIRRWVTDRKRDRLLKLVERPRTDQEFLNWLSSKELVVTGRYHTVTLCILTRTPFIFVESNTPKISALLGDAGLSASRKLEEFPRLSQQELVSRFAFSSEELGRIEQFLAAAERTGREMIRGIVAQTQG